MTAEAVVVPGPASASPAQSTHELLAKAVRKQRQRAGGAGVTTESKEAANSGESSPGMNAEGTEEAASVEGHEGREMTEKEPMALPEVPDVEVDVTQFEQNDETEAGVTLISEPPPPLPPQMPPSLPQPPPPMPLMPPEYNFGGRAAVAQRGARLPRAPPTPNVSQIPPPAPLTVALEQGSIKSMDEEAARKRAMEISHVAPLKRNSQQQANLLAKMPIRLEMVRKAVVVMQRSIDK
eukprot:gene7355-8752_t